MSFSCFASPFVSVLLITLTPYHSTEWQTALNDFLAFDSDTQVQPFLTNMKVSIPLWISILEPMPTSKQQPPTPTLQSVSTTQRCSCHPRAWITQLLWMGILTNDAVSAASGARVIFLRRGEIPSWVHPLPNSTTGAIVPCVLKPGFILYHLCALPPSWPGNNAVFFLLPGRKINKHLIFTRWLEHRG